MSINDLQNINNMRQTHHYIKVESTNINKEMSQEQNLFDMSSNGYKNSNNNQNEFLLFPSASSYEDDIAEKYKINDNLFL